MPDSPSQPAQERSVLYYFRQAAAAASFLPATFRLIRQSAPGWTLASLVLLLFEGLLPLVTVYLTRPLVNSIVSAVRTGGNWRPVVLPAALMGSAFLLGELLGGVLRWVRTAQADLVQDHISSLVQEKSVAVDLAFYESPDFYDHLHRARGEAGHRPVALLEVFGSLLQNAVTLVAMVFVLARFAFWLPAALLVGTVPAFLLVLRYAVKQHQFRLRATSVERRAWYYDWLLTSGESAAEVRLFALGGHFRSLYRHMRIILRNERLTLARSQSLGEMGAASCGLVIAAVAYIYMIARAIHGGITVGDLALFHQAFQQGMRLTQICLENVGQLYQNSLFLGNLFEFLALEPVVVSPATPVPAPQAPCKEIRFEGITFRYPDTRALALSNFQLTIGAGSLVAIVGPNGAGKSTLLKLLCRFYDPDAGSITIDGTDLRAFPLDELRRQITVLFQQPVHYNTSVRENIALGNLAQAPSDSDIESAARSAGADSFIGALPDGYQNLLGHWFEKGTELSVGEWQRIALARAFVHRAPIIILDEPTSAMDPWAEAEWLNRFRVLVRGRTAIVITHRFTTAKLADTIYVMDEGRIVESGSHAELIGRKGLYAQWCEAQKIG